jgi:hypothetical protein
MLSSIVINPLREENPQGVANRQEPNRQLCQPTTRYLIITRAGLDGTRYKFIVEFMLCKGYGKEG